MTDAQTATTGGFVNDLGNAVRENPLPAALIGMGVIWLFTSGRSPAKAAIGSASETLSGIGPRLSDGANHLGQSIGGAVASVGGTVRDATASSARRASDAASSLRTAASDFVSAAPAIDTEYFSTARSSMTNAMRRQPLLLGAIGLAIGAGVAASLRTTATEADLLGEASAKFQERVRDAAADQTQRATDLVEGVATAVAQEARVQGLTPEAIKGKTREAGQKLKTVFDQATGNGRER
jgi:hypothetical protein